MKWRGRGIDNSEEIVGGRVPLSDLANWVKILEESGIHITEFTVKHLVSNILAFREEGLDEEKCFEKVISELQEGASLPLPEDVIPEIKRVIHRIYEVEN